MLVSSLPHAPVAFVASPSTALALSTIKEQAGSNKPLLQPDPTQPAGRTLAGLPLVTSPDAPEGLVWGVPKARAFVVLRSDVSVALDSSAFFTSDRVAVRVTMRVEFGFPHEAALVRVLQQDEA